MSRRNNKSRRAARKERAQAWSDFNEKYPCVGSHMPVWVYCAVEASQGREAAVRFKKETEELKEMMITTHLERKRATLAARFQENWRDGVEALGEAGWAKNPPPEASEKYLQAVERMRLERQEEKRRKKETYVAQPVEYVDEEGDGDEGDEGDGEEGEGYLTLPPKPVQPQHK